MTDHLPECWCAGRCPSYPGEDCPCRDCICVELRACEQRIKEESARGFAPFLVTSPLNHDILCRMSYNAALDAAREAVAGALICTCLGSAKYGHNGSDDRCPVPYVVAAIQALKGKP